MFSVWRERAVERWQGERFEFVRRIGQIFVAILAGVCSKEVGQLTAMERLENLSDEVTEGRSSVRVMRIGLNEVVGW